MNDGPRIISFCARLALVGATSLTGCGESIAPAGPPLTTGEFVLERVDGTGLPTELELPGGACMVNSGSLELLPDTTLAWHVFCAVPAIPPQNYGGFGIFTRFRQITSDSLIFPRSPIPYRPDAPFGAAKIAESVLTVRTAVGAPLAGPHEWTFRAIP